MPDHPSWPAELVETAARFLRETDPARMGCICYWDEAGNPPSTCRCEERNAERDRERARNLLSALSGDLVPREQAITRAGPNTVELPSIDDEVEVEWSSPFWDVPGVELIPRSQADALAEALETYAEQIERDRREPDLMRCVALSMRESAASYRSSSSTEGKVHPNSEDV